MLTDLLSTVAEGARVLLEEEDYIIARTRVDGRSMFVEIARGHSGGIPPDKWPEVEGLLIPDSAVHPVGDGCEKVHFFSIPPDSELLLERMKREGAFSEQEAVRTGHRILAILRRLHDAGKRVGYLGPENIVLTPGHDIMLIGGCRGVPDSHFSPPETVGLEPEDPRSDVYALGVLIFRMIAGSDDRDAQIEAWNRLSEGMERFLEKAVSPEADERYANLMVLTRNMRLLEPSSAGAGSSKGAKCLRSEGGERQRRVPVPVRLAMAAALFAAAFLLLCGRGRDGRQEIGLNGAGASGPLSHADPDSVPPSDPSRLPPPDGREPVIWVSNGTGSAGAASELRRGPLSNVSSVYTCTAGRRSSSVALVRREDPLLPHEGSEWLFAVAETLAGHDSSLKVLPVDITILLGGDLEDDRLAPGILSAPASPAGTLFVDIANHGLEGTYGGTGAATWLGSVIDGRSVSIDGGEWMLSVADIRNGDEFNDELGIPGVLASTRFMYRADRQLLMLAESEIRKALLPNTPQTPAEPLPPPPDIWVLLGR